jgi:hypothetical protein
MIDTFVRYFETKTGVYLHPRFVLSVGLLLVSLVLFGVVSFIARSYAESVKTIGPVGEKAEAEYDARMRAPSRGLDLK